MDFFRVAGQISRLHLILKPFMLRRIKKDVENELTDKVEVLLYCPLTLRQKLLYRGLKQKIRIEELLQNLGGSGRSASASANSSGDNAITSSLMNLVMQFRKVSSPPEIKHTSPVHPNASHETMRLISRFRLWTKSKRSSSAHLRPISAIYSEINQWLL